MSEGPASTSFTLIVTAKEESEVACVDVHTTMLAALDWLGMSARGFGYSSPCVSLFSETALGVTLLPCDTLPNLALSSRTRANRAARSCSSVSGGVIEFERGCSDVSLVVVGTKDESEASVGEEILSRGL